MSVICEQHGWRANETPCPHCEGKEVATISNRDIGKMFAEQKAEIARLTSEVAGQIKRYEFLTVQMNDMRTENSSLRDAFLIASALQTKLSKAQDIVASIQQLGEVIKEALASPPKEEKLK